MAMVLTILAGGATATMVGQSLFPPLQRELSYRSNRWFPNALPSPLDAIELRRRGLITTEEYYHFLKSEGYNQEQAQKIYESSKTLLTGDELLILKRRGLLSEPEYYDRMSQLGFTKERAELFDKARLFYPSPGDLIVWQAKEVFEEDSIKKYGLDDELELLNKEAFYKAGIDDEQIRNYWIAHWQHPPLGTVFELLHRTTKERYSREYEPVLTINGEPIYKMFSEADLYDYYRLVEIPPYWRKRLTELSYNPLTRVDVRRMYELGVINREQVKQNYLDLGYNDENAELMTEFTQAYALPAEKDLSRTMIEKSYEIGVINRKEAIELLMNLGYDEQESDLILYLKEYAIYQEVLDNQVATIKTSFRRGLITESEAVTQLDKLTISADYRDRVVAEILREKQAEFKLPEKDDLIAFVKAKLISEEQFKDYMSRLGYRTTEIELYWRSLK